MSNPPNADGSQALPHVPQPSNAQQPPFNTSEGGVHASIWAPEALGQASTPHPGPDPNDKGNPQPSGQIAPMDLDVERQDESEVANLLDPALFIVIPAPNDPRRPRPNTEDPALAPSLTTANFIKAIRREIQFTVQESVQNSIEEAIGKALKGYNAGHEREDDGDGDDEGDDELGSLGSRSSQRRKKSQCENSYHNAMRGWLGDKKLRLSDPIPQLPASQEVADFVSGTGTGPNVDEPLFDWTQPFSHVWNDELLGLLGEEWIEIISDDMGPEDIPEKFFDLAYVKTILKTKLRGVKSAFLRRYEHSTGTMNEPEELIKAELAMKLKTQIKSRQASRTLGTLSRRKKIVEYHLKVGNNLEFWLFMHEMVKLLGRKGMSDDESDEEQPAASSPYSRARKIVRRVPIPWLNCDIAHLWRYVEAGYRFLPPDQKRGNPPYDRHFPARPPPPLDMAKAQHLAVVKHLPINWYDPVYWKHLTPQGRRVVSRVKPKDLPKIPDDGYGEPMDASSSNDASQKQSNPPPQNAPSSSKVSDGASSPDDPSKAASTSHGPAPSDMDAGVNSMTY